MNARRIFGPDVSSLKDKTVSRKEALVELTMIPIPSDVMQRHKDIILCFDIMYINRIAFLVSISRSVKFCTARRCRIEELTHY